MSIRTLFLFIGLGIVGGCTNCVNTAEFLRDKNIHCIVDCVYVDHSNRGKPTIKVLPISGFEPKIGLDGDMLGYLYSNASSGDTIVKMSGSLKFTLIKDDTTMDFYPICKGSEIK